MYALIQLELHRYFRQLTRILAIGRSKCIKVCVGRQYSPDTMASANIHEFLLDYIMPRYISRRYDIILSTLRWKYVLVNLHDIFIISRTAEEHT